MHLLQRNCLPLTPSFNGDYVARSLVIYVSFVNRCLVYCPFPLTTVLSVLRFMASDYPFGIFKLFFGLYL